MIELPKLPVPPNYESEYDDAPNSDHYSADQMQAYARQAVQEERDRIAAMADKMDCAMRCGVGSELAAAIRAQK